VSIDHDTALTNEFHRVAAEPAPPYDIDLEQVVASGRRAKRRRRTARTTLATTAAVVALCGVAAAAHTFAQPGRSAGALGPAAGVPSASSTAPVLSVEPTPSAGKSAGATTAVVVYLFPVQMSGSSAAQIEGELRAPHRRVVGQQHGSAGQRRGHPRHAEPIDPGNAGGQRHSVDRAGLYRPGALTALSPSHRSRSSNCSPDCP
jgi:hypothetical protein